MNKIFFMALFLIGCNINASQSIQRSFSVPSEPVHITMKNEDFNKLSKSMSEELLSPEERIEKLTDAVTKAAASIIKEQITKAKEKERKRRNSINS